MVVSRPGVQLGPHAERGLLPGSKEHRQREAQVSIGQFVTLTLGSRYRILSSHPPFCNLAAKTFDQQCFRKGICFLSQQFSKLTNVCFLLEDAIVSFQCVVLGRMLISCVANASSCRMIRSAELYEFYQGRRPQHYHGDQMFPPGGAASKVRCLLTTRPLFTLAAQPEVNEL